ncbi:hypothetical protein [uncultured Winogradskyella sp.]|uniref:hypothetical protein n=1 Tax=uncultured Winogradskyella sp. TaxID=395353 RepID=UPI0030D6FE25|tara:strand:+ start:426 stop:941 length:516 start_codon:yes stop_codon:yes gene_type:complete
MKRDIRDLFKEEGDLKKLPKNHRTAFLEKLKNKPTKKRASFALLKVVAVLLVALSIGLSLFYDKPEVTNVSPMIAQIEAVEAEYLASIKAEWESFIAIAEDEILVTRFRKKLDELDKDYKDIALQFKEDTDNILVVESLVENLQNRLQILKDIQAHIKILNQKNEQNENTI